MTTRSGLLKSLIAAPSFRNSGLEAMWKVLDVCEATAF